MVDGLGRFVWYELITTDAAAAKAFYAEVVGWAARDVSTPNLAYTMLTAENADVAGLMELPEVAQKRGATSRWAGYIEVDDIDGTTEQIKRLGGSVFVPPTDSNIGRVSIVADPQTANFALVKGLKVGDRQPLSDRFGHVSWHQLLATDRTKAFAFYRDIFGWQNTVTDLDPRDTEDWFTVGGQALGAIFNKGTTEPVPYWLYFFNVGEIDDAAKRVQDAGGQIFAGPVELLNGSWIVACRDPQGAAFALRGKRGKAGFGWSAEWEGFASKGRLFLDKGRS